MCVRETSNSTVTTKRPSAEATLKFMAKSHLSGEASCALKKNKVDKTEVRNALSPSQRLQLGILKNSNNRKIASARGMMKRGKRRFLSFPFPSSLAHFFFLLPSKPTTQGPLCLGEIGKPIEIKVPVGNSKPAPRTATSKMEKRSKLRQG